MEAWTEVVVPYPQGIRKAYWEPGAFEFLLPPTYVKGDSERAPSQLTDWTVPVAVSHFCATSVMAEASAGRSAIRGPGCAQPLRH